MLGHNGNQIAMNTELLQRIRRIYSSIKDIEETDPNKLKASMLAMTAWQAKKNVMKVEIL